jgi:hypothetical protein
MRKFIIALALGSAALFSRAEAVVIPFSTAGAGSFTVFTGAAQQSQLNFQGCPSYGGCPGSVDLTVGTPLNALSHGLSIAAGSYDPATSPTTTFDFDTVYMIAGHNVTLTQSITYKQIANQQFQFSISASDTKTVDLGGGSLLDITALSVAGQFRPADGGGGQGLSTTFLLRSAATAPVPEPETWAMMIAGFGLTGAAMRRRRTRIAVNFG